VLGRRLQWASRKAITASPSVVGTVLAPKDVRQSIPPSSVHTIAGRSRPNCRSVQLVLYRPKAPATRPISSLIRDSIVCRDGAGRAFDTLPSEGFDVSLTGVTVTWIADDESTDCPGETYDISIASPVLFFGRVVLPTDSLRCLSRSFPTAPRGHISKQMLVVWPPCDRCDYVTAHSLRGPRQSKR